MAPSLPPIDCPLRKQGINIDHAKPFAEVEKYIAFLERPDRAKWQRPDEVVSQLRLKGTEIIADVGAGSGYFSFRLAHKLPVGKVYAIDIDPAMLRHIRMHYALFKKRGLLIGSGAVESIHAWVIQARCRLPGMRWSTGGVNAMLRLRCSWASRRFDEDFALAAVAEPSTPRNIKAAA